MRVAVAGHERTHAQLAEVRRRTGDVVIDVGGVPVEAVVPAPALGRMSEAPLDAGSLPSVRGWARDAAFRVAATNGESISLLRTRRGGHADRHEEHCTNFM